MSTSLQLKDYTISIDNTWDSLNEFLLAKSYSKYFVLVDEHTQEHCLPLLHEAVSSLTFIPIVIASREEHKNLATCQYIWQQLLAHHADRNALMINLGGGVIGDMGGFAASCYKRGIDFAMIPTTLLSQVDSSIGGKLGVDLAFGKNLIGIFANPKWVYINTHFLHTLPPRQLHNGWAEIYKHALIYDKVLWDNITSTDNDTIDAVAKILPQALMVKKTVVEIDPYEKALRKILNFGHTIGHAIESHSLDVDRLPLLHGEAIFLGMIMEAYISTLKVGLDIEIVHQIITIYKKLYIPYMTNIDIEAWMPYMYMDKKNVGQDIRCTLIKNIGEAIWDISITKEDVLAAVTFYEQNM